MKSDELKDFDPSKISLFNDDNINELLDNMEEVENIDMEEIDKSSSDDASKIIENILSLYSNEEFMKQNPRLKQRIDTELESLRILLKMRKADEITHDILIKAIAQKPSNASLYRSMTEVQKTILSITTDINKILDGLKNILKNYQLEINFDQDNNENNPQEEKMSDVHRGSKDFINQMLSEKEGDR